ncbi:MAG: HAMP domain-containing histidine kinase [Symploca sp. SIO3C6]|nr:HAMP domain-containing histidine kinase [Symploca sp. SIO3C6]
MVPKWSLLSLSEVLARSEQSEGASKAALQEGQATTQDNSQSNVNDDLETEHATVQRQWSSAIKTLEELLLQEISLRGDCASEVSKSVGLSSQWQGQTSANTTPSSETDNRELPSLQGLVLAGPVPVLSHPDLLPSFQRGIFSAEMFSTLSWMPLQLAPANHEQHQQIADNVYKLPLLPMDPLATEQFCLVFSKSFSLVMVAGFDLEGSPAFQFSFDPEVIDKAWRSLHPRILLTSPHQFNKLETLVRDFAPQPPDYRLVMQFGRLLLKNLPQQPRKEYIQTIAVNSKDSGSVSSKPRPRGDTLDDLHWQPLQKNKELEVSKISNAREPTPDLELLQALTHEIRTPLTTICTLTKLLLKRRDLPPEVLRRLEIIDRECTEQINRMELIFRAVELETTTAKKVAVNLTSMSLAQVIEHNIPQWQKQAQRCNLTLDVVLPQQLPAVVSNPNLLTQVLTGLMENFTRSVPAGNQIQVQVIPAGNQLKLQFQSQSAAEDKSQEVKSKATTCPTLKSIGQLLMFQPETGSLSLNLDVTKNLFHALGGKLIVRQRPQAGRVMTVFLPLEVNNRGIFLKK